MVKRCLKWSKVVKNSQSDQKMVKSESKDGKCGLKDVQMGSKNGQKWLKDVKSKSKVVKSGQK